MPGPIYASEAEEKNVERRTFPQTVSPLGERVAASESEADGSEIDEVSWSDACTELDALLTRLAEDDMGAAAKPNDPLVEMALSLIWEVIEKSALKKWIELGLLAKELMQDLANLRARKDLPWTEKLQSLIGLIEQKATYPAPPSTQLAGYTEETFSAAKAQLLETLHLLASAGSASDAFATAPLTLAGLAAPLKAARTLIETPVMARALGPQQKLLQDLMDASEQQADFAASASLQDRLSQLWEGDLLRSNLPEQWHGVVLVLDELWRLKKSAHELSGNGWMSSLKGGLALLSNSRLEPLLSKHLTQQVEPVFSLLGGVQEALKIFHAYPAEKKPLALLEWVLDEAAKSKAIAAYLPANMHGQLQALRTTLQNSKRHGTAMAGASKPAAANPMGGNAAARMRWLAALLSNPEIQLLVQRCAPGQEQTLKNLAEWLTSAALALDEVEEILAEPSLSGKARMAVAFLQNEDPNRRALVEQWLAPSQLGEAATYFNAYQNAQNVWSRLQDYPAGDLLARLGWGLEVMQDKDAKALMAMVLPTETMRMLEVAGRLLAKFQSSESGGGLSSAAEWFKDEDARALLGMLAPAGSVDGVQMLFDLFDQAAAYPSDQSFVDQFRWLAPKLRQHGGTLQNHLPEQTAAIFAQVLEWSSVIEKIFEYFKDGARPASWQEAVKAVIGLAAVMWVDGTEKTFEHVKEGARPTSWQETVKVMTGLAAAMGVDETERMIQRMVRFMGFASFVSDVLDWIPALKSRYDSFPEKADSRKVLRWLADSISALPMGQKLLKDGFLIWMGWNPAVVKKAAGLALGVIEPLETGGKFMFVIANMAYLLHKNGWTRVGMEEIRREVARYMDLTSTQASLLSLLPVIPGLLSVQKAATAALPENASYRDQANAYLTQLMQSEDPALQASVQRSREMVVQPAVAQVNAVLADGATAPDQLQTMQAAASGEASETDEAAAGSQMMRVGIAAAIALLVIGIGRAMIGGMSDDAELQRSAAEDRPESEGSPTGSRDAIGTQKKRANLGTGRALTKATKLGGAGLTIAILSMLIPGAAAAPTDGVTTELPAENVPSEYPLFGEWLMKPEAYGPLIAALVGLLTSAGALLYKRKLAQARARTPRPEEIPLEPLPSQAGTSVTPGEDAPLNPTTTAPNTCQQEPASNLEKAAGYVALFGAISAFAAIAVAAWTWFSRERKDPYLKEAIEKIEKRRNLYGENSAAILNFAVSTVLAEPIKDPENGISLTYEEEISKIEHIPQEDVSGFVKKRVKKEVPRDHSADESDDQSSEDDEEDASNTEAREKKKLRKAISEKHTIIGTSKDFPLYVPLPANVDFLHSVTLRNKGDCIDVSELRKGSFIIYLPPVDQVDGRSILSHQLLLIEKYQISRNTSNRYEVTYGYGENDGHFTINGNEQVAVQRFVDQIEENNKNALLGGMAWRVSADTTETEKTLSNPKEKIIFEDYLRRKGAASVTYLVNLPGIASCADADADADERDVDITPLLEAGYPIKIVKTFASGTTNLEEVYLHVYERKKPWWFDNLIICLKGHPDSLERIVTNTDKRLSETSEHGFVHRVTKNTTDKNVRLGSLKDRLIFDDVPDINPELVFKVRLPAFRYGFNRDERDVDISPLLRVGYEAEILNNSKATLKISSKDMKIVGLVIEFSGEQDVIDKIIDKTHERIEGAEALHEDGYEKKNNYSLIINQCNAVPGGWAVTTATDLKGSEENRTGNEVIVTGIRLINKTIKSGVGVTVVSEPPGEDVIFTFNSNNDGPSSEARSLLDIRLLLRAGYQISLLRNTSQYINSYRRLNDLLGQNKNGAIVISNGNKDKRLFFASDSQAVVDKIRKMLAGQIFEYAEKKQKPSDPANTWTPPILLNLSNGSAVAELLDLAEVGEYAGKNLISSIHRKNVIGDQKHREAFFQHQELSEEILEKLMHLPDMRKSANLYMADLFMDNFSVEVDPEKVFFNAFSNPLYPFVTSDGRVMYERAVPKDIEPDEGLKEGKVKPAFSRSLRELAIQNFPIETAEWLGNDRSGSYTTGFYNTNADGAVYSSKNRIHHVGGRRKGKYIIPQEVSEFMNFERSFLNKISFYFKNNQNKFIEIQRKLAVLRLAADASKLTKAGLELGVDMITATDDARSPSLKIEVLDIDTYLLVDGFFGYRDTGGPVLLYLPHISDIAERSYYEYANQAEMRKGIQDLLRGNSKMKDELKTRFAAEDRPTQGTLKLTGNYGTDKAIDHLGGRPEAIGQGQLRTSFFDVLINTGEKSNRLINGDPFKKIMALKERKMTSDAKYQILTTKQLQLKLSDNLVDSFVTPLQFMSLPLLFLMPEVGAAIGVVAGIGEIYGGVKHLIEGERHEDKVDGWKRILSGGFDVAFSAFPLFRVEKMSQHLSMSKRYSEDVLNALDESRGLKLKNIMNPVDFNDAENFTARKATEHLFQVPDRLRQTNDEVLGKLNGIFEDVESSAGLIKKSAALNDAEKKAAFRILAEEAQASIRELDEQIFRVKVSSEIWNSANQEARSLIVRQQELMEGVLKPSLDKAAEDFDSWIYQKQLAEDHLNSWASNTVEGYTNEPVPSLRCARGIGSSCMRTTPPLPPQAQGAQPPSAKSILIQSNLGDGVDDLNYDKYSVPHANIRGVRGGLPDIGANLNLVNDMDASGTAIYKDAKVAYKNKILQAEIPSPALPSTLSNKLANGTGEHDLIDLLLQNHNGIIIGENHMDPAARKFLVDNMPYLRSKGIDTIFLEGYTQDFHQSYLTDDFLQETALHSSSPDRVSINQIIHDYSSGQMASGTAIGTKKTEVMQHAYANDIKVVAIDSLGTTEGTYFNPQSQASIEQRLKGMNFYASQVMKNKIINDETGRYIALVGSQHISKIARANTRWGLMNLVPSATGISIETAARIGVGPGISRSTYKHGLRNYFEYKKL